MSTSKLNAEWVTVNTQKDTLGGAGTSDYNESLINDPDHSIKNIVENSSSSDIKHSQSNSPAFFPPPLLRSSPSLSSIFNSTRDLVRLPSGSLRASVFTLISGCVGGGTLTLSYGIYMAGTLPSLFYLILSTLFQMYTAYVLVYCSDINKCSTFRKLAIKLYNKSFATFIQMNELLLLWCIAVSYMTFCKNLMGPAVQTLIGIHDRWYDNGIVLLSIFLCCIITPLSLKRKISALRYSSLFGFCAVSFTVLVVMILYFDWCSDTTHHDAQNNPNRYCIFTQFSKTVEKTKLIDSSFLNHTYTVAVMVGGFTVQPTILPIYYGMKNHTPHLMLYGLLYSFVCVFILYTAVAYCGYLTFPDSVSQNLLTSNYGDNTMILVSQIALSLYVVMVTPLFAHAFRSSVKGLLIQKQKRKTTKDMSLISGNKKENDKDHALSTTQHFTITILYLLSAFGVAVVADNIGTVNSLVSSTTMPICCFFFPAAIVWKTKNVPKKMIWITVAICVIMTANSILQIIRQIIAWS